MAKSCRFLLGVCAGANILAGLVAHCLLYSLTGKLPIWEKGRARLVTPSEVADRLRALADHAMGRIHG